MSFDILAEDTEHPVVTIKVSVPGGVMLIMGEPEEWGRTLIVNAAHISSQGLKPNDVGISNLRVVATVVMEAIDYDEIEVRRRPKSPESGDIAIRLRKLQRARKQLER